MALAANSMEGKAEGFLKRIETMLADGESAKSKYMSECKERRGDLKEVYTEAKDAGVPPKALKGLVKKRDLERKVKAIADGLEDDDASAYETLCEALGPLGQAAARAAGHAPAEDDEADLRPDSLKRADAERADEEQLSGVGRGKGH